MKQSKDAMTLKVYTHSDVARLVSHRPLETKIGEALTLLPQGNDLAQRLDQAKRLGARFALLGVPEDLGPKANLGKGGAELGWQAFLSRFLNLQSHPDFPTHSLLLLGELELNDLQTQGAALSNQRPEQLAQLRELVAEVDRRLAPLIEAVARAGLVPIVIGGGHNNAYPIIRGVSQALGHSLGVLNLDPHADFRPMEGRHSGNGFRYAQAEGYLGQYQVLAMHPFKNSAASQQALKAAGFGTVTYPELFVQRSLTLDQALDLLCGRLSGYPAGLELDMDVINLLPASAYTNTSLALADVEYLIHQASRRLKPRYLHLCEAAPARHPAGEAFGMADCGQALAAMVLAFVTAFDGQASTGI
ncbi:arginase family protein [Gallaecimonas xiamenensis]|nr:arginase family protein [Gallaecimonas xiamenensis]